MLKKSQKSNSVLMLLGQDFLFPKIDPRVYKEAKSLVKAGYPVTILYLSDKDNVQIFEEINLIAVKDRLNLSSFRNRTILWKLPSIFVGTIEHLIRIIRIANKLDFRVVHAHDADMILAGLLIKLTKRNKFKLVYGGSPKLVYGGSPKLVYGGSPKLIYGGSPKLVYDSHEIATEILGFKAFRILIYLVELISAPLIDGFITINEHVCSYLIKKYPKLQKNPLILHNVPNMISTAKVKNVHKPVKIVYEGSLKKGRIEVIEAFAGKLAESKYDWHLTVYCNIEELSRNSIINNHPRIRLHKMIVDHKEFFKALSQYDLGLIAMDKSSLNNYYSLPNKLFDYMACGVAVIAPNYPEIAKVIKKSNSGYFIKKNIDQTIEEIFSRKTTIYIKKKNGFQAFQKYYNWSIEEKKLYNFYSRIIKT